MSDTDPYTTDTRCTCTHRYPHHTYGDCRHCDCREFRYTPEPVTRRRTGPPCPICGQELLITPAGQPCIRCALQLHDTHP